MMEAEAEDTPKEPEQQKVTDAGEVFLLMKKDYRISRNIRSQWFFSNLHKTVQVTPDDQLPESERELEVLSVLPQGWKGEPVDPNTSYRLVHTSKATFLARRYRFVFALDLSPSTSSVDGCRGRVMLEEVFAALENCLSGLTEPYSAPGSGHVFTPQIYVTVIAYTPLISYKTQQVIIQGCLVTQSNLPALLATVRQQFYEVENKIAEGSRVAMQGREGLSGGMFDDIVDPLGGKKAWDAMVTPDVGLVNMLRYGILALQLLPDNTSARIVVITDGVTAMPNMEMMESLLVQLRSSTIACSFLQLGSAYRPSMSMGYVLHNQLLKFLAAATFGAYLEFCPGIGRTAEGMNMYQKALFEWHFQKGLSELPLKAMRGQFRESVPPPIPDPHKPRWMWNEKAMSACPIMRKKHSENTLQVSIFNVLAVRLREGYTIKEVNMTKNDTQIEVKVVLPWKHDVTLEYTASSAWPPKDTKRITQVEVSLEGSYDFLHDITCPMKKPFKSAYRTSVVKRFWQTVHGVSRTDQLLVHIQSFASNPRYYVVPESVRNGVPLFYMSHSSAAPVPSLQHSEMKETGLAEFAAFWQPMVQLDTNVWQRWLHTHRITILLTHDKPLPYHLHIPGPNGRYDTIQCRVSFTEVHKLLSKETSFVLVESYCYVKLLFSNKDKPPTSFFVVRVSSKPPCMVVRLAFLGGTPGHIRNEIVTDIKEKLNTLSKRAHKVDTPKGKSSPSKQGATEKTEQGQAERACLVLQAKPLEKMLIRYEKVPSDYTSLYSASVEAPAAARVGGSTPLITVNKTATTMFGTLSRYLYHQRWVWGVQLGPAAPVTAQDAARILATLTKTRLREGFSFAHCYSGMVSMVAEVHMRDPLRHASDSEGGVFSCFLQYVLFPPHTCTTKDSVTSISTDDDELETTEADGELQIIVECWIEPQCGVVINSPVQQRHLEGLEYQDIPQALLPFDSHIISALVTFQHLSAMCGNRCVPSPTTMDVGGSGRTTPTIADYGVTDSNIKHVFFPFDLVELLPHCQKVSMQFQACRQEEEPQEGESQPKGQQANRDLFKLMHDRLTELTHRELPLSEDVSTSFTKTLTTESNVSTDHKADDTIVEDTESTETEVGKAATGSKKKEEDSSTPQTEMKSLAAAILEEQVPEVEWKCYMKSVRAGNVVLTVLPKTYKDVVVFDNYRKKKEEEARLLKEEDGVQGDESPDRHDQETHSVLTEIAEVEEFKSLESVEETMTTSDGDEDDQSKPSTSESDGQSEENPEAVEEETRQDDVEEEKLEEEEEVPDANPSPVTIPIYIFSCQQSCLLRQLELGVGETTPETVRDHRFDREGFLVRSNSQFSDFWKSRESVRLNADQRVDSRETIDEDFSSGDSFKDFCDQVSDGIQQSFVTAVFQSLQDGVPLDHLDVQAAVENVCEEQLQEIDITEFLGTLCGHLSDFQHLRRQRLDSTIVEDLNETKESIDTVVDVEDKTKFFSLSSLPAACESTSELHKTIKEKFAQTVGKYFQPVPSSPDLYFYCSPRQNRHSSQQAEDATKPRLASEDESSITTEEEDNAQSDSEHIRIDSATDSDIIIDDTMETTEDEDDEEDELRDGRTETLGSISVQSEFGSRESVVLDEATSGSVPPLFLNLTCSLRSGSHRGSMGVTQDSLPTCVKDVSACLDPSVKELDLSDFYVTLDIICLTLPGLTISEDSSEHRPELNRMTSSDTTISSPVGSPQDFQTPRSTEQDFFSDTHMEPLDGLPEAHRKLVLDFVDQVNFLLKDEITAALRLIQPVTIETLEKVAAHVHDSSCRLETGLSVNPLDLPLTIQEDVPLQFVFGSDQSHAKFVEALDDLQLPGYKLEKVWPWYYTALDPNAPQWKRKAENLNDSLPLSSNSEFIVSPRSSREHSDSVSTSYSGREHSDSFATVVDTKAAKLDTSMAASPMDKPSMSPLQETSKEQSSSQVASPEEQLLGLPLPMDTWECLKVEEEDKDEAAVEKAIDSTELIEQGLEEQEVAENAKEGNENVGDKTVLEEHPPIQQEVQVSADSPNENKDQQGKNESQSENKEDSDQREPGSNIETEKVELHADEISDKTLEDVSSDESEHTKQHTEGSGEPLTDSEPIENLPSEQTTDNSKNDDAPALQSDDSKSVAAAKPEGPVLPNFWLIMKVSTDKVEMFCHARKGNMDDHSTLFETLGDKIRNSCKLVNQKMLLQDLHDTRTCNSLLVAEDDEDIWLKDDYGPGGGQVAGVTAVSAVEDFAEKNKKYLAATMQYMPGYFACDCVCRVHFSIHQRLKTGPARGVSRGQQALRSALSAFSVNNQKNMFVFQERTGAVFYLQLFESMCVSGSHNTLNLPEVGKGEDENSLLSSRTSSLLSLPIRGGAAELEEDIREYQQAVEKDSGVETVPPSQTGSMSSQGQAEESVVLMVHGVQPAGAEIRVDLVQILQHRLDDATLDVIILMLARNPMCRLSPADVLFIQPPSELPTHSLRLAIPAQHSAHIQAVDFYLKQNLLQFLHNPKFSDNVHFQDVDRKSVPQTDQDVFLYNRPQESGGKGLACIILGHVDKEGNYIQPLTAPKVSVDAYKVAMTWSNFKALTETHRLEGSCSSQDGGAILQFHIWERGDIDFKQLAEKLSQALQHALCDVITEYYMLTAPIAELEEDGEEEDLMDEELMEKFQEGDVSPVDGRQMSEESVEEPSSEANLTWKDREVARRKEEDHKSLLWKLQSGSEGVLHTMYMGRVQRWFDFMVGMSSPAVVRDTQAVNSRYAIPILLRELCDLVHLLAKDNTLRVYKHCQEQNYTLLKVPKGPPKSEEVCHAPGLADNYILLARSLKQWRECMDVKYGDLGAEEEKPAPPVSYKGVQKFKAQERKSQEKLPEGAGPVPRQRLMIVEIRDTQITTYQYNWAGDLSVTLRQQLAQLSQWHNARSHLLKSLLVQKLGLFHHHPYQVENAANPFLRYSQDADLLVKCSAPPVKELQARAAQNFRGSVLFHPALRKFDQCLRDVHLRCAMHQAPYASHPNPVFRHGIQAQEARNIEWGDYDTIHKLKSLYLMWQHRSGQVNVPIPDDLIDLMKMQSRLVHYCTTPLLYHPFWLDQENGKVASKATPSDDSWLMDLSSSFLQQYIQYLQSLGFVLVQTRPPSPRRMARMQRHSKYHAPAESSTEKTTTHHLQRTIPGGVLFMELSLHSQFFTVRQFALESHRLGLPVNSHLAVVFTDECDKYKDLKHLHSFSHDFHLRCAALYMSGRQLIFPQCYDLSTFLAGVVNLFSRPPRFSQNHILSDTITEECPKLEASQLFGYTLEHADSYGFKSLVMSGQPVESAVSAQPGETTQLQEFALISLSTGATPHPEVANLPMNDFDVSLFVVRNKDPKQTNTSVLSLQYYVILTSRRDMFPRLTVDEKIAFRTRAGRVIHRAGRPDDDIPPWLQLLLSESVTARQKITGTIDDAQLHCRRDHLWNRLKFEKTDEERKGRRSESDEKARRESFGNAKLSFDEFQELMSLVVSRALTDMDPSLTTLLSMGTAWYQGLLRVLQSRFPAKSRHFTSPDTHHHYLAVLSNHDDNFILLHMNTQTRFAELSAVFRVENQQSLATNGDGSPASDLQRHLEAVVNAAAFHLWSSLL